MARRDVILRVLAASPGVDVEPSIPAKKLANARAQCEVPDDELVLGLIDCTFFGSARRAIVFGERSIYMRDAWTGDAVIRIGYTELGRFERVAGAAGRSDNVRPPTRHVIDALHRAIDGALAASVSDGPVAFVAQHASPDDTISPEATALQAAIVAAPEDDAPQLVLADLLLAADDPRGELIVFHHRELAGGLEEPEALERYLSLAAVYGFPHAFPEPPTLPFVLTRADPVQYGLAHQLREFEVRYDRNVLDVLVGGRNVLSRRLRTERPSTWTTVETAVILRGLSDAIHAGTPLKLLQFPFGDDPLPDHGGALRVYSLPRDYTGPRFFPAHQFGLAARDYQRWMDTWRRLARMLKQSAKAESASLTANS